MENLIIAMYREKLCPRIFEGDQKKGADVEKFHGLVILISFAFPKANNLQAKIPLNIALF